MRLTLFLIFLTIMFLPIIVYGEIDSNGNMTRYVGNDVFTTSGNHTITSNGKVIGSFQSSDPKLAGKLVILQFKDESAISPSDMWLITGAFLAVAASVGGILLSDWRTRKDQSIRIRPIISRAKGSPDESPVVVYDDHFSLKIINHGSLPAIKIKKYYKLEIRRNDVVIMKHPTTEKEYVEDEATPCSVGESYFTRVFCPSEFIDAIRKTNECHFELKLIYSSASKEEFLYNMTGHFDKGEMIYGNIEIT